MRGAMAMMADAADPAFDLPPRFAIVERRMAGQALDRWQATGRALVAGFELNSIVVAVPLGELNVVTSVGTAVVTTFGLQAGPLPTSGGLVTELRAACALIATTAAPQMFEATLPVTGGGCILLRGVALPIGDGVPAIVQAVVNWREVLNRSATLRLQREFGAALAHQASVSAAIDPFSGEFDAKSLR